MHKNLVARVRMLRGAACLNFVGVDTPPGTWR